ncbi:TIGR02450 family Trp-rich protein [Pseudomonas aestusnigri]|uniref:TIGR02450 family Trp-rich protein n=1 Tax=Halopseudomonas aestusnigri TaxID=857252 RepID=UPI001D190290|nr:TIGR02450 family Trp-rich protein [Halopseudomonas aestusnigri]MCC4262260.1 TIGR02450 family Trp-rich protein [Halopseudomonas aestusnigri]
MNRINPKKLIHSKWTAVAPVNREKHFMITDVEVDEEGQVIGCEIEAVLSRRQMQIDWSELKDDARWLQGWK